MTFDADYDTVYRGSITGCVDGVEDLAGERELLPYVAFDLAYDGAYAGPVAGAWKHVSAPADYRVDVYSISDAQYLQGSFPLRSDGTWSSGEAVARAGEKLAQLVRRSDDLVVATSGQPETKLADVAIDVFSRTDADYLQERVPLAADGSFRTNGQVAPGMKIARLVNVRTGRVINSTEWADSQSFRGLVHSFSVPQDDPDYGYDPGGVRGGYRLEQRSFIYDDALAVLAYLRAGESARAEAVLEQLAALQNLDGSLDFSYDTFLGRVADPYRRTGAIAWIGYAAVQYARETNDERFDTFTQRLADYLLSLQVTEANGFPTNDPRAGSILGGRGRYASDGSYTFEDVQIPWASTEHNIDAYFFLRDLGDDTGEAHYETAAAAIRESLLTNHWNAAESRFYQGVSPDGLDAGHALDLVSWGGLFLLAVGEDAKARQAAAQLSEFRVSGLGMTLDADPEAYNMTFAAAGPLAGYKPYADSPGYEDPPTMIWSEGTWGALLLRLRLGEDVSAELRSLASLQAADAAGGLVQVSRGARRLPWEFHVWPAVGASAWQALVVADPTLLWAPEPADDSLAEDGAAREPTTTSADGQELGMTQTLTEVATDSADGFSVLGTNGTAQLTPVRTRSVQAADVDGDTLVFEDTGRDVDTIMHPAGTHVDAITRLRSAAAGSRYTWQLAGADQTATATADGGLVVRDSGGETVAAVAPPSATDAAGNDVATRLTVTRDTIQLNVDENAPGVKFPVEARLTLSADSGAMSAMSPPGGAGSTPNCDGHVEDQRPFVLDVDTGSRPHGPTVRWAVKLNEEWLGILAAAGHVTASRFSGKNWVQSSTTHQLVNQGGPSKRFVLINYHLHSSIYKVHGVGYKHLRWNDYVQVTTYFRSRSPNGVFTGKTAFACEPRQ